MKAHGCHVFVILLDSGSTSPIPYDLETSLLLHGNAKILQLFENELLLN